MTMLSLRSWKVRDLQRGNAGDCQTGCDRKVSTENWMSKVMSVGASERLDLS
jgi:hypothetical protein